MSREIINITVLVLIAILILGARFRGWGRGWWPPHDRRW
jgi:hypothetical protein